MRSIRLAVAVPMASLFALLLSCSADSGGAAGSEMSGSTTDDSSGDRGTAGTGTDDGTTEDSPSETGNSTSSEGSGSGGTIGSTDGTSGASTGGAMSAATGGTSGTAAGGAAGTTGGGVTGGSSGAAGTSAGGAAGGGTTGTTGGHPLKNAAVPSTGCGKPLSKIKSGTNTYRMTSAGLNREYIVALPDNYDSQTTHRVVFGMHWMNGSADAVQGWSKWFGLRALDKDATIFIAPNGYGTPPLWNQGAKDHTFFDDLVKLLKSELCVDTSRIFSVGFSFGAMFSNALAQTHQDVLRAIVVYAAADYNIYFPANTGKPLGYMGVHGLKDPTCPIAAGRSSRDRFVKNNGCAVPATVPEAKSGGSYVTYDYKCPSNYPVRWVTFDGKHTYPPNDNGTWVYGLTWEFITQF